MVIITVPIPLRTMTTRVTVFHELFHTEFLLPKQNHFPNKGTSYSRNDTKKSPRVSIWFLSLYSAIDALFPQPLNFI